MKKANVLILVFVLLLCTSLSAFAASDSLSVAFDGKFNIVTGAQCSETDAFAARTLQKYTAAITGNTPRIITDDAQNDGFEIAVGNTNRLDTDFKGKLDGSSVIKSYAGGICIAGAGTRGTIYGVYAFLQKYCGCNWFTSKLYDIPTAQITELPININDTFDMYFEYTDTDWLSPHDTEYSLANGLSGGIYRDIPAEQGGTVEYLGQMCHTLTTCFCKADTYFEEHPEYFALYEGKRDPKQLCLTNEGVFKIVKDEVMQLLREQHDPSQALQIISITQNDNKHYCECDACKALDNANGAHSGSMITFVNKIAREVAAAGYSNVAIDTFAYQYTRKAPSSVVPEPNVIVRLCTIECCFSHALNDPSCEENTAFMQDLTQWNALCNRLYIWDYTTNYSQTIGLFPDFGVIQSNMQTFCENGVKGVYEEGNYYMAACDTEFGELRAYLLSKLMQNPYCDYNALMKDFCDAYYGEGAADVLVFIDIITQNASNSHLFIYNKMTETLTLSAIQISECDSLWSNAKAVCTDETQLANIKRSELSWRYWKACNGVSEFKGLASINAKKQLYADITDAGVSRYNESSDLKNSFIYPYINPEKWVTGAPAALQIVKTLGYGLGTVLFSAAFAAALVLFVLAIKRKRWLYLVHLPLMAGMAELALWHRRAFLAWKNIGEYALTIVIACAVFALFMFACKKARPDKLTKKKAALNSLLGVAAFIVPYEAAVLIINNVMYSGNVNDEALGVAYLFSAISLFAIIANTAKSLKNNKGS